MSDLNRRRFMETASVGVGAASLVGLEPRTAAALASPAPRKPVLMKLGTQEPSSDDNFQRFARYGIKNVGGWYEKADRDRLYPTVDELNRLKELGAKYDISIDMIDSEIGRGANTALMLGEDPARDREIEAFQTTIKNCAATGIPTIKYYLSILPIVRSGEIKGRGDLRYNVWNAAQAVPMTPLTKAGRVDADTFWERITYFLDRVVPVANEYKIRLAQHPHDPGTPPQGYMGVENVLGTFDGLKRFLSIQESPYHGMNFCQGTMCENLENPNVEIFDVIRYFGERRKIFNVHFRNIKGHRGDFVAEIPPDVGDVDFFKAVRVYRDVGYDGMLMPDHISHGPTSAEGEQFVFDYGYIRALLQAAEHIN